MKTKYIYLILLIIISLSACTERIDIDLDETYTRLVVDAELTDEAKAHTVKLSMTSSFLGGEQDPPVTGAIISIDNTRESHLLNEVKDEPGVYKTDPTFTGIPGETYTLRIELQDEIDGHKIYTSTSTLYSATPVDSIGIRWMDMWEVFEVQCYAWDPPTVDFYMFDVYINGTLITDTISEKFVVDDKLYNGRYTNGIGVGYLSPEKPDEDLQPGDTVTLRLARITKENIYYIWEVQQETGYHNPLFGGPPANIDGNISNGAIGFFSTFSAKYASKIYQE